MKNLKSKISRLQSPLAPADGGQVNLKSNQGFTLMELIVVVAIMAVLAGVLIINLGTQRSTRDLRLAQSQLVSNFRKIQSYTLSSRLLPSGLSGQFHLIKFHMATPTQYSIQAMSNVTVGPQYLDNLETVKLPNNVVISQIMISRPNSPTSQSITTNCALAGYAAPFAKAYLNDGCSPLNFTNTYIIQSGDDYKKIVDFVSNITCVSSGPSYSPSSCSVSVDSVMSITLIDKNSPGNSIGVVVNGITGTVCPAAAGSFTCLTSY